MQGREKRGDGRSKIIRIAPTEMFKEPFQGKKLQPAWGDEVPVARGLISCIPNRGDNMEEKRSRYFLPSSTRPWGIAFQRAPAEK
ncbi:hypothetical protein MRB53_005208 [Persea americana]|uniref:Uncharacterized protein n=1 Tax=Persea americana TaxID=3435 RepID=A0ACC2MDF4_PERAE|nr:hypothetical protein MRB53_005208 [Persea americana]